MKIRNLLKLAVIGGAVYAHRKRGGTWTLASLQDSANALLDAMLKFASTPGQPSPIIQPTGAERTERTGTYADTKARMDDSLH